MSANAHHCCIVFSNNESKAMGKLEEIAAGASHVEKLVAKRFVSYIIDGDEWRWLRPNKSAIGHRAHKAWVDEECSLKEYFRVIKPMCYLYCHDLRFF